MPLIDYTVRPAAPATSNNNSNGAAAAARSHKAAGSGRRTRREPAATAPPITSVVVEHGSPAKKKCQQPAACKFDGEGSLSSLFGHEQQQEEERRVDAAASSLHCSTTSIASLDSSLLSCSPRKLAAVPRTPQKTPTTTAVDLFKVRCSSPHKRQQKQPSSQLSKLFMPSLGVDNLDLTLHESSTTIASLPSPRTMARKKVESYKKKSKKNRSSVGGHQEGDGDGDDSSNSCLPKEEEISRLWRSEGSLRYSHHHYQEESGTRLVRALHKELHQKISKQQGPSLQTSLSSLKPYWNDEFESNLTAQCARGSSKVSSSSSATSATTTTATASLASFY